MLSSRRWVRLGPLVLAVVFPWHTAAGLDPQVSEIVIHPARVPRPPLKYRLLPRVSDQVPGVAAPLYAQAFLAMQERKVDDETWRKTYDDWLQGPALELPEQEVSQALEKLEPVYRSVELAARRPSYGWDVVPEDPEQLLSLVGFRALARLVELRIRFHLLRGEYEEAIHWLQTGYATARHCAEQPTLPGKLVGIAIAGVMNHEFKEVMQLADVPNLYWTITALPDPMFDLQPAFDFESQILRRMFPEFERAGQAGYTPERWRALYQRIIRPPARPTEGEANDAEEAERGAEIVEEGGDVEEAGDPAPTSGRSIDSLIEKAYPVARRNLQARGAPQSELDRMSPAEVVVRGVFEAHETQCEDMTKWYRVPYWEAKAHLHESLSRNVELSRVGLAPQGEVMDPAVFLAAFTAAARCQRDLAGLRCVEAIRLCAAHNGKLPQRLEDVTEVSIPVNPMTGKPFPYRAEERYVILDLDGDIFNRQWWIRLAD